MIHALIRHQQIFIVMGHPGTVDMGPGIALRYDSQPFMIDFVCNIAHGAILRQLQHSQLPIVITGHEQIVVRIIRGQIASPHAVDCGEIDEFQAAVLQYQVRLHPEIRDGI